MKKKANLRPAIHTFKQIGDTPYFAVFVPPAIPAVEKISESTLQFRLATLKLERMSCQVFDKDGRCTFYANRENPDELEWTPVKKSVNTEPTTKRGILWLDKLSEKGHPLIVADTEGKPFTASDIVQGPRTSQELLHECDMAELEGRKPNLTDEEVDVLVDLI